MILLKRQLQSQEYSISRMAGMLSSNKLGSKRTLCKGIGACLTAVAIGLSTVNLSE